MASLHLKYLTCETGRQTDCLVGLSRRRSYNTVPCLEECPCDMYLWVWEAGQGFPGEVVLEPRRLGAEHEAESWTVGPSVSPASSRHESCWVGHSGASLPRRALTSDPGESRAPGCGHSSAQVLCREAHVQAIFKTPWSAFQKRFLVKPACKTAFSKDQRVVLQPHPHPTRVLLNLLSANEVPCTATPGVGDRALLSRKPVQRCSLPPALGVQTGFSEFLMPWHLGPCWPPGRTGP